MRRTPVLHLAIGASARTLSKVVPKLTSLWLERIFVTPRKFARPEREIHWMAGADAHAAIKLFAIQRSVQLFQ